MIHKIFTAHFNTSDSAGYGALGFRTFAGLTLMTLLSGCGASNQDSGKVAIANNSFSGVAVDGHIARAKVFIDSNNNATRDPWEPYAFTDDEGYYSYNPNTDINYCANTATPEQHQYCLSSSSEYSNVVVRIDGGYDRVTGEPFLGQLSRRINANSEAERENIVVTPLTTLLTNIQEDDQRDTVFMNLGIDEQDLDIDYLNTRGNSEVDGHLLNVALKVHKTVTVLSDAINDNYTQISEITGLPNDGSQAIYQNLANALAQSSRGLDAELEDPTVLAQILTRAESDIRTDYDIFNIDLPSTITNKNSQRLLRTASVAAQISNVVDVLLPDALDIGQVIGNARALEALVIKSVGESNQQNIEVDNAFNFFLDADNKNLIEDIRLALSSDNANLISLVNNSFDAQSIVDTQDVIAITTLPENTQGFQNIPGKQLRIADLDLGFAPNNLDDSEIELFFNGNPGALSGSVTACAKYIDDASSLSLGEGNSRGELLEGFWSLLGANAQNPESYSLLLTFEFLGASYQAILKPAGKSMINGIEYSNIRFDFDGDIQTWHSTRGLIDQEVGLPTSSTDCESRLPSRIGL